MKLSPSLILKVVGVLSIVGALFGLWYSVTSYQRVTSPDFVFASDYPYFYPAFFVMIGISSLILLSMLWSGIQLFYQKVSVLQLFIGTCVLTLLVPFVAGSLWLNPIYGKSIAAASGVSTGGLSVFLIILFPIWAPLLIAWSFRRRAKDISPSKINA
jgi:hypothetical protein